MTTGRIVTFYSYKGGVGRTSALANAAWILASNGYRVCAIDWDLEAPGLHRYFYPFLLDRELTATDGLIDLLIDYLNQAMTPSAERRPDSWYKPFADLSSYAVPVDWEFPKAGRLDLVVAGRQGPTYASKINSFEWQTFYQHFGGSTFIDEVKRQLREEYDFVLIDSRTGVSDTAGICTAQLPDQLVACFMLNAQSIEGTAAVAESAIGLRPDNQLRVFPVPMRVELAEKERLERARTFARHHFSGFLHHIPPSERTQYWGDVEILYEPYYAYEEVLAAFSDSAGGTYSLLGATERLCDRLTEGLVSETPPPPAAARDRVLREYGRRFAPDVAEISPQPAEAQEVVATARRRPLPRVPAQPDRDKPDLHANPGSRSILPVLAALGSTGLAAVVWWLISGNNQPLIGLLIGSLVVLLTALAFITPELSRRWRVRLVDRLDQGLRRKVSRFDRRYREFVLSSLRFIDVKGLATVGFYTPELDEVFVDVSLAYRAPHQIQGGLLTELPVDVTDRHSIGDFLDRPSPVVLAIVGPPGSGKTTLLRHTARTICRDHRGRRRPVPILLYLRDHGTRIVDNPDVSLPDLVHGTLGRVGPDEPPGWFDERLRDGNCVVLLDGLDEMASQQDGQKVADWIERQTMRYPKNDYVITSRPQGYRVAPIDGAIVLQARNFTDEQITRFVRGWYLAVERHSTGASTDDIRTRADSAADDLIDRLNANPGLHDLTVNPLLLTMTANVHRYRGALPGSRVDLYSEICQVALWRRQEAKNLPVWLSGDKKEQLLRALAFEMMLRRVRDLPRADIFAELKPALRRVSTTQTEADFLADVSSSGLLVERQPDMYSFAHIVFQEHMAAAYIRDRGLVSILVNKVDDLWWRETTLLYAARSDIDPIVEACLSSGTKAALALAFDCVEQGSEISPELLDRLARTLNP